MAFDSASTSPPSISAGMPPSGLTARCQSGRGASNGTVRRSYSSPSTPSRNRTFCAFDERG